MCIRRAIEWYDSIDNTIRFYIELVVGLASIAFVLNWVYELFRPPVYVDGVLSRDAIDMVYYLVVFQGLLLCFGFYWARRHNQM